MGIIPQGEAKTQETPSAFFRNGPTVLTHGNKTCILVKDVHAELEAFIQTGKTDSGELGVFAGAQEKELIAGWLAGGFTCTYHIQTIEYMHKRVPVRYLAVGNPRTALSVSLIPWWMVLGRPYPVFVYSYAAWHYSETGRKSMGVSARAAGKVFGVESFNKSTLSRILNGKRFPAMRIGYAPDTGEPADPPDIDIAALTSGLLENNPATQGLREPRAAGARPSPAGAAESIAHAFASVPGWLSKVTIDLPTARQGTRDARKRPQRRRRDKPKRVQRPLKCVDSGQIERIRKAFIASCKAAAMDAAVKYHRFLI